MPTATPNAPRHDPLLTIEVIFKTLAHKTSIHRTSIQSVANTVSITALIDSGASAPVMSPELANKLGYKDKGYLTRMTQADGTKLESHYMVSAQFTIGSSLRLWQVDAEVLPIGNRQLILGLSWLRENGLSLDPIKRTLTGSNCNISCSKLQLPMITLVESLTLENADCVMILDATLEYSKYRKVFSDEQAKRMLPHRK